MADFEPQYNLHFTLKGHVTLAANDYAHGIEKLEKVLRQMLADPEISSIFGEKGVGLRSELIVDHISTVSRVNGLLG